ncbi:MAG: ankyrin repeat domain-containing protein, partial [Anaerolineae bacterium]
DFSKCGSDVFNRCRDVIGEGIDKCKKMTTFSPYVRQKVADLELESQSVGQLQTLLKDNPKKWKEILDLVLLCLQTETEEIPQLRAWAQKIIATVPDDRLSSKSKKIFEKDFFLAFHNYLKRCRSKDVADHALLLYCIKEGHTEAALTLLGMGVDTKALCRNDTTLLHWACKKGQLSVIRKLVDQGCDINAIDSIGMTALHRACQNDHLDVAKFLLSKGAFIDIKNKDGETSLHIACEKGFSNIVELLIGKGARIDAQDQAGRTPLHNICQSKAAEKEALKIFMMLLKAKAKLDIPDEQGATPLLLACQKGDIDIVILLANDGANCKAVDKQGRSALHYLTESVKWDPQIPLFLMQKGLDINIQDNKKKTPLHEAIDRNNTRMGMFLLPKGASSIIKNADQNSPLELACKKGRFHLAVLCLREGGGNIDEIQSFINTQDEKGRTLLHYACSYDDQALVQTLLKMGADYLIKDKEGYSPKPFWILRGREKHVHLIPQDPFGEELLKAITRRHVEGIEDEVLVDGISFKFSGAISSFMHARIADLLETFSPSEMLKDHRESLIKAFKRASNSYSFPDEIATSIQLEGLVNIVSTGWKQHAVDLVFYTVPSGGSYVAICNGVRGSSYGYKPLTVFPIDPRLVDERFIREVEELKDKTEKDAEEFLYQTMPKRLSPLPRQEVVKDNFCMLLEEITHKAQKIGNCSYAAGKMALRAAAGFLTIGQYKPTLHDDFFRLELQKVKEETQDWATHARLTVLEDYPEDRRQGKNRIWQDQHTETSMKKIEKRIRKRGTYRSDLTKRFNDLSLALSQPAN